MKTYKLTDKTFSRYKKLSLSYILKLFLDFSKFDSQYPYKLHSYKKVGKYIIRIFYKNNFHKKISLKISLKMRTC